PGDQGVTGHPRRAGPVRVLCVGRDHVLPGRPRGGRRGHHRGEGGPVRRYDRPGGGVATGGTGRRPGGGDGCRVPTSVSVVGPHSGPRRLCRRRTRTHVEVGRVG